MGNNYQVGPENASEILEDVIRHLSYKPGWHFAVHDISRDFEHLAGGSGWTLQVTIPVQPDSVNPGNFVGLDHFFAVPPADYDRETWERWVLDCVIQMETHEAMEFFKIDGWAPYFPPHGNRCGKNPYTINRRNRASKVT